MRSTLKIGVGIAWLLAIAGFFIDSGLGTVLRLVFWILVVVHSIECLVFLPTLKKSPRPLAQELLGVFLFGVIHAGEVKELTGEAAA